MARTLLTLSLTFILACAATGCTTATVRVRQDDGTYRTTRELVSWSPESYREFTCQDDYMVASTIGDVTYEWPTGKGYIVDLSTTTFEGDGLSCEAHNRMLMVNGERYGAFEDGDHMRITPDARVLVNGVEQAPNDGG